MVRIENVLALQACVAASRQTSTDTEFAMRSLVRGALDYHREYIVPLRGAMGGTCEPVPDGQAKAESLTEAIRSMRRRGIALPYMPLDEFCDTVVSAVDDPNY